MSYGMVPPPPSLGGASSSAKPPLSKRELDRKKEQEYNSLLEGVTTSRVGSKKRTIIGDDYFEQDSDEEDFTDRGRDHKSSSGDRRNERFQSRESSKIAESKKNTANDEEDDELEAFMAEINQQAAKDRGDSEVKQEKLASTGEFTGGQTGQRYDIDEEDMQESYFKYLEEYKAKQEEENEIYEYDEDGNIIWTWKKVIDPLPDVDHSTIDYKPFNTSLYVEHPDILNLSPKDVFELRNKLDIRVFGSDPPKPVASFAHFSFDEGLMKQIRKSEFERPTPIQAQAIPAALSGRDVLGLAQTGSGKTVAYLWPAIVHIMDQEELQPGEGPIALVIVPTRELAIQVYQQARIYCKPYNINVVCAYGGGSKYEQQQALQEGAELVIGTPGRIIDMVKIGATNFFRTTFLVFDEADRMFDLGFEAQVKSIADHIRPDRQCLMFSATFKRKVEQLAYHALQVPIKVVCGDVGEANADVLQTVHVLPDAQAKWNWLTSKIVNLASMGKVLIFVTKKASAEEVAKNLRLRDIDLVLLHGDMLQHERNEQITAFRNNVLVMVATDVAARGLDIPEVRNVINYDVPRDSETYIHRIGRTGRAGQHGFAYTLVTEADKEFAGHLVKNLESAGQNVPNELMQLALKSSWFKSHHDKTMPGDLATRQRMGLGFKPKERPGFGFKTSSVGRTVDAAGSSGTTTVGKPDLPDSITTSSAPSLSKALNRAKNIVEASSSSSTGNTGMNRIQMMRSALKSSFQHTFQRATSDDNAEGRIAPSDPRPQWKIELEKRAAMISQAVLNPTDSASEQVREPQIEKPNESLSFGRKKRSRWE